ncbi:hypothetical protein M409DRAFT_23738 [Zasmidium cellare ATCC 36951]|uniref:Uncharacterized protein n=1 Tax=Zasmidium cellare ATCC 36951 TaxID=1080233 RepID=A0A6A6CII7_ZASCE|nr:uncharacterized protein M409DRAFT_23738 [Zasmidium cellare ATCC 36951]KAF2166010.1 hypothetical protein M409DRAFT_23738 [Zasmidium cellare ATCC 36951]
MLADIAVADAARKAPSRNVKHDETAEMASQTRKTITTRLQVAKSRLAHESKEGATHGHVKDKRERLISIIHECFNGVDGINNAMIEAQEREIQHLNRTIKNASRHSETLEAKVQKLELESIEAVKRYRTNEKQVREQHTKDWKRNATRQKHDLAKKDATFHEFENAAEEYIAALQSAYDNELTKLDTAVKEAEAKHKKALQGATNRSSKDFAAMRGEYEMTLASLKHAKKQAETRHAQELQQADKEAKTKAAALRTENEQLSSELEGERNDRRALEQKREEMRDVRKKLNGQITKLKHDLEGAKFRMNNLESDNERMKGQAETSDQTLSANAARITALNDDNRRLSTEKNAEQDRNAELLVDILLLTKDVDDLVQTSQTHLDEVRNSASDEIHGLLLELEESRDHARQLKSQRNQIQETALQRGLLLQVTNAQHRRTRRELEASRTIASGQEGSIRELTDKNSRLARSCQDLSSELAELDESKEAVERVFLLLQGQRGRELEMCRDTERGLEARLTTVNDNNHELRQSNHRLVDELAALDESKEAVDRELLLAQGQYGLLEQQHGTSIADGIVKRRRIDQLQDKMSDATDRIAASGSQATGYRGAMSVRDNQITMLQHHHKATMSIKDDRIAQLEQKYQASIADGTSKKRKIDELQEQADAAESQASGYRAGLSIKDSQISMLQHHHKATISVKDARIARLEQHYRTSIADSTSKIDDLQEQVSAAQNQASGYRAGLSIKDQRISTLQSEKRSLEESMSAARAGFQDELGAARTQAAGYRTALSISAGQISHAREASKQRRDRTAAKAREAIQGYEDDVKALTSQVGGYKANMSVQDSHMSMLQHERADLKQRTSSARTTIARLTNDLTQKDGQMSTAAHEHEGEVARLNNTLASANADKASLDDELGAARSQARSYQTALTVKDRRFSSAQHEHAAEVQHLEDENVTLNGKLSEAEEKIVGLENKVKMLEADVQKGQSDMAIMRDELQAAAMDMDEQDASFQSLMWRHKMCERMLRAQMRELERARAKMGRRQRQDVRAWNRLPSMLEEGGF